MRDPEPTKTGLLPWLPPTLLSLSAGYLGLRYDDIPERWVTHWDVTGTPNGWSTRTLPGVFGLLVVGALVWGVVEVIAGVMVSRGAPELQPVRDANVRVLRLVSASVALLFAALAVTMPLGPHLGPGVIVAASLGLLAVPLGVGSVTIRRALSRVRAEGHGKAVEGYHGLYYAKRDDERLWVPKLGGGGYTINFAHPWAWPVMGLLTLGPLVAVLLGVIATRR